MSKLLKTKCGSRNVAQEMYLTIKGDLIIPDSEVSVTFARASGPGGQNVNKLNTKVLLRWHLTNNTTLALAVQHRIQRLGRQYLTQEGDILIVSGRYRSQLQNLKDCQGKLKTLILKALTPPRKRIKTKLPKSIKEKRLQAKKHVQTKKEMRKKVQE